MIEIRRTDEFANWLRCLRDVKARARINLRIDRLSLFDNYGDFKSVGGGIYEMRVDCGPGYRLYFTRRNKEIVLLLIGGDKSSQQKDIAKAQVLNEEYE